LITHECNKRQDARLRKPIWQRDVVAGEAEAAEAAEGKEQGEGDGVEAKEADVVIVVEQMMDCGRILKDVVNQNVAQPKAGANLHTLTLRAEDRCNRF